MKIRAIENNELDFLFDLVYEAAYIPDDMERPPKSFVHEPHVSRYVENFGRGGDIAFVLVDGSELVGGIWCRLFSEDCCGFGFVDESTPELGMAVFDPHRGQGFGTKLMHALLESLNDAGFENVSLSVDKRNPALRLYERCGFQVVREKGNAITMVKAL
ncbi:MAG TPA: GNAT family N-acetyltransferase [Pyrinomonadaceae bacterium]|nr:GNAT family N-acetyltransferase [Pyrinomonadaceae bacterium]